VPEGKEKVGRNPGGWVKEKNMAKKKVKILTIFGTRKELIRLYPVLDRLKADEDFGSVVVGTSQYQEAFDDLYDLFGITPDHDLCLRRNPNAFADITNLALSGLEPLLKHHQPHLVLVQGESTSAFIGALAAFYNKMPVAHNGAGVRTFKKMAPYPEEVNRRMVSTLSDLHFAVNSQNSEYLLYEGAIPKNIFITGDTIIDSILSVARRKRNTLCRHISPDDLDAYKMVLVTCHRKENWGKPLKNLCGALVDLTQAYPDIQIAFPLKFNPEVRETVFKILDKRERIHLLDQLPYAAFVEAMVRSHLIITDSDCIVEEGLAVRKPVLLFREKEETTGSHLAGCVKPIGLKRASIVVETSRLIEDQNIARNLIAEFNMGGDGHAAERIVQSIRHHFGLARRPGDYVPKAIDKPAQSKPINSSIGANDHSIAEHHASGVR
jgi:UDP-N-acetylglucosamine 2-epimerase (non-hydrolysing)